MNLDSLRKTLLTHFPIDGIKEYGLDFLLYFTCCLPFLRIIPLPSDVQPYALIVAVIYLYVNWKRLKACDFHVVTLWLFLLVAVVAFVGVLFDRSISFMMLARKVYNYLGLFVISLALFNSFLKTKGIKENWIKGFILLWLFVGLMQTFVDRNFMGFLVSNYRTTDNRGVAGLASEPSFYGYAMVFFFVLANEFKRHRRLFQGICLLQVMLLAQSAVAFVYLAVFVMMFVVKEIVYFKRNTPEQKKRKLIIAAVCLGVFVIAVAVMLITMAESRMVQVFKNLLLNIGNIRSLEDLYAVDESVAERVEAIVAAFRGFAQSWGLPGGFGEIVIHGVRYERIMSGFGAIIYELGVFGVALVLAIAWSFVRGLKNGFVLGGGIAIIMFSAVQLGSPIFVLVFTCALYAQGRVKQIPVDIGAWLKRARTLFPHFKKGDGKK